MAEMLMFLRSSTQLLFFHFNTLVALSPLLYPIWEMTQDSYCYWNACGYFTGACCGIAVSMVMKYADDLWRSLTSIFFTKGSICESKDLSRDSYSPVSSIFPAMTSKNTPPLGISPSKYPMDCSIDEVTAGFGVPPICLAEVFVLIIYSEDGGVDFTDSVRLTVVEGRSSNCFDTCFHLRWEIQQCRSK
ncbi:hypothetical protein H5410_046241 [Solanum commersonii]|uniref:Uncharacterized protein n=1 Tax=Solanum commersonii TaxID=4109 RepID=A0A9J5XDW9_SOLCO|nr:hypothetical protein H5410_046241 [Solanum commersonii]